MQPDHIYYSKIINSIIYNIINSKKLIKLLNLITNIYSDLFRENTYKELFLEKIL